MSKTYAQLSLGGNNDKETVKQLQKLLTGSAYRSEKDTNRAFNLNDKAAVRKKHTV